MHTLTSLVILGETKPNTSRVLAAPPYFTNAQHTGLNVVTTTTITSQKNDIKSVMMNTTKKIFEFSDKDHDVNIHQPNGPLAKVFDQETNITQEGKKSIPSAK